MPMRDTMWIYAVITFLLSEAWSMDQVASHETFNLGSEVNLTCLNETRKEVLFVTWNIEFKTKKCRIGFINGKTDNFCKDGKFAWNSSDGLSNLHIPHISEADEGQYKCELVYSGGTDNHAIHVAIRVPPSVSAWIYHKDNKAFAVCKAERGKPAATISWNHMGNVSSVRTDSNGYVTVESSMELPEGMNTENLSCEVSHPSWERIIVLKVQKGHSLWLYALIVGVIILVLAGFLVFAQKKIIQFRRCQQSNTTQSKSTPADDVEEVEPYASYVQRVNSIYNSSADLFT